MNALMAEILALARSCAKWRNGMLLVAFLPVLLAVGDVTGPRKGSRASEAPPLPPPADSLPLPPGPIIVGKKGLVTAGDTLLYTITWGPGARATSYDVTRSVSASNGTWTVVADSQSGGAKVNGAVLLPNTFSYTRTTLSHRMWLAAIPWDSATFTVTIVSRNAIGTSSPVSTSWKVSRKPGPPGPITVDSSAIVIGVLVLPDNQTIGLGQFRLECGFQQFGDGAVTQWTAWKSSCDSIYATYVPLAARTKVKPSQQAHTDSLSRTCVVWSTTNVALGLTPLASCSSAVRVTGLGLTRRFVADATRYAARTSPLDAPHLPSLKRVALKTKPPRVG